MRSRHFDHIRNLGSVELDSDRPNGSRATRFLVNGHELTLDNAGFHTVGADVKVNGFISTNQERRFDVS